jgi:hypothetical protein
MNFTQSFTTGIYPYSMMLSVFNPIEEGRIHQGLKATASVQEWCGHTFAQINKLEDGYLWRSFSYFESEGDLTLPLEEQGCCILINHRAQLTDIVRNQSYSLRYFMHAILSENI